MKAHNITKLKKLAEFLDLVGYETETDLLESIIADETPKPKAPPKPKEKPVQVEVTEGDSTYSLTFDTSAKFEKWAKDKVKTRRALVDAWQRSAEGVLAPFEPYRYISQSQKDAYIREVAEYHEAIKKAGLNFEIKINP
jgi:hypothetical protein